MMANINLLCCLTGLVLLLCLDYTFVICKNDDSGIGIFSGENIGPESIETCDVADCSTTTKKPKESQTSDLAVNKYYPNFFKLIYGSVSNAINTVYRAAASEGSKLYSTLQNSTAEFAEAVREVLREEFSELVVNGFSNIIASATAPG